jgi:hypothetical protein
MKISNKHLLAAIAVFSLTTAFAVQADDTRMTPRAQANAIKHVSGNTPDLLDRSQNVLPPKLRQRRESLRKVAGTTPDLLDRSYAGIPKQKERFGKAARTFAIAPLK